MAGTGTLHYDIIRTPESRIRKNEDSMFGQGKKTAYWIRETHLFREDRYICSECGGAVRKRVKVCPDCGAEMTEGSRYEPTWVDEAEAMSALLDDDW